MIALSQSPGIDPSGVKDSTAGLQAVLNGGVPITADCPVTCIMGTDITKGLFVPSGSNVTFTPRGQINVDNIGFPALCFYHAKGVVWTGTTIRYTGQFGALNIADNHFGNAWNDGPAKQYLIAQQINTFTSGGAYWTGPTNACALLSVKGASEVSFLGGTKLFVDNDALASGFIPVACALEPAFAPGTVAPSSSLVSPTITVDDFLMDGVYMGFVGSGTGTLKRITRRRYADLQDPQGNTQGGVSTWFAPPHCFYLTAGVGAPMNLILRDVVDEGVYCGNPLRRLSTSGMMHSLKADANGILVDGYYSRCLDGGLDYWSNGSGGGRVRNAFFIVDTSIKTIDGNQVVSGLRFPSAHPYPETELDVTIKNLALNRWPAYTPMLSPGGMRLRLSVECGYGA